MTGPDCADMCNLIKTQTHRHKPPLSGGCSEGLHAFSFFIMYGNTSSKSNIQPGKVASPARGQLKTGKMNISPSVFVPENSVSRDGFGSILRLNLVLNYGIPPEFRGGVHLFT